MPIAGCRLAMKMSAMVWKTWPRNLNTGCSTARALPKMSNLSCRKTRAAMRAAIARAMSPIGLALSTAEKMPAAAARASQGKNKIDKALHERGDLEGSHDRRQPTDDANQNADVIRHEVESRRQLVGQHPQEVCDGRQQLGSKLNGQGSPRST